MRTAALFLILAVGGILPASAQPARTGRLLVTVADQTGAIIPTATVTVAGIDEATKAAVPPVKSSEQGVAAIEGLLPGRYTVQAEFEGFEPGILKDVRVRPGDNKQLVVLRIRTIETAVTVQQDAQDAAADRAGRRSDPR